MPLYSTAWSLDTNQKLSKTWRSTDRGQRGEAAGAIAEDLKLKEAAHLGWPSRFFRLLLLGSRPGSAAHESLHFLQGNGAIVFS